MSDIGKKLTELNRGLQDENKIIFQMENKVFIWKIENVSQGYK